MEHIIAKLLNDFEHGLMNRRQLIRSIAVAASAVGASQAASPEPSGFKAVTVNHISYQVADYAKTRDFYVDLLGMGVKQDTGNQCYLTFGDSFLLPRNARRRPNASDGTTAPAPVVPRVDHIAYTIETWDKDKVKAELERRGLNPRPDTEDSFHVKDPDGFDLQISGKGMKA